MIDGCRPRCSGHAEVAELNRRFDATRHQSAARRPHYESWCQEVADSTTWRRFCRIPLDGAVPHRTTLMKLTTRCGIAAVEGLNETLLAKAVEAKVLRTSRLRAEATVIPANVA